jgi:hypothetical protein
MDINTFMNYIKPELLILVFALYFVGALIKLSATVSDNRIPLILGLCGVALAVLYVLGTSQVHTYQDCMIAAFTAITQGVLCAGCSVYVNQLIKQASKDD